MPDESVHLDVPLAVGEAVELQDQLLEAATDLDRLGGLLEDAAAQLMARFAGANSELAVLGQGPAVQERLRLEISGAMTALQFQDMASQLINHTNTRLRSCADRLAAEAMGEDEDGEAVVEAAPLRPNPVTQDEMDAGSIELF